MMSDKKEIIEAAMKNRAKITFMYSKINPKTGRPQKKSERSRRTIRPIKFAYYPFAVVGHCDLRDSMRTFAISRMYEIQQI